MNTNKHPLNGKFGYLEALRSDLWRSNDDFRHTPLYKLLKIELTRLGYWKNKPRGNPSAGHKAMIERTNNA